MNILNSLHQNRYVLMNDLRANAVLKVYDVVNECILEPDETVEILNYLEYKLKRLEWEIQNQHEPA